MNSEIELLQDWIARNMDTKMHYDGTPSRYQCQIYDAIEHIIAENAQYSEHNMKVEQALIDTDRALRLYKTALKLALKECLSFRCSDYCGVNDKCDDCYYKKEYTEEKFLDQAVEMLKDE
jgi:hypothetical protein